MSNQKLPTTDSIAKLAEFWDSHDLTDFDGELEEVEEQVFEREATIPLRLPSETAEAVQRLAKAQGLPPSNLIESWVLEKIASLPSSPNAAH